MPGAGLLRCHWSSPKKMIHQRGSQLERLNHCASSQGRFEFETFCSRLSIRDHMKSDRFIDNGEWKTKLCQTTTVTTNHPQLQVWEAIWNVIFCTIEASLDSTESDDWSCLDISEGFWNSDWTLVEPLLVKEDDRIGFTHQQCSSIFLSSIGPGSMK